MPRSARDPVGTLPQSRQGKNRSSHRQQSSGKRRRDARHKSIDRSTPRIFKGESTTTGHVQQAKEGAGVCVLVLLLALVLARTRSNRGGRAWRPSSSVVEQLGGGCFDLAAAARRSIENQTLRSPESIDRPTHSNNRTGRRRRGACVVIDRCSSQPRLSTLFTPLLRREAQQKESKRATATATLHEHTSTLAQQAAAPSDPAPGIDLSLDPASPQSWPQPPASACGIRGRTPSTPSIPNHPAAAAAAAARQRAWTTRPT